MAEIGSVGNRAADRINRRVTDDQVEVRALCAESVVGGGANLRTCLPPAVLATNDTWLQTFVEPGAGTHGALWRLDRHPVARGDATLSGGVRM